LIFKLILIHAFVSVNERPPMSGTGKLHEIHDVLFAVAAWVGLSTEGYKHYLVIFAEKFNQFIVHHHVFGR